MQDDAGLRALLKVGAPCKLFTTSPQPDRETGVLLSLQAPPSLSFSSAAVSLSGGRIALADQRGNVFLLDLKENAAFLVQRCGRCVTDMFLHPNKIDVIIALSDGSVQIINRQPTPPPCVSQGSLLAPTPLNHGNQSGSSQTCVYY